MDRAQYEADLERVGWRHLMKPDPDGRSVPGNLPELIPEAARYVEEYIARWADAVAADPPPGDVVRGFTRWFTDGSTRYFSVELVAEGDSELTDPDPDDRWAYEDGTAKEREHPRGWSIGELPEIEALFDAFDSAVPTYDQQRAQGVEIDEYAVCATVALALTEAIGPALAARGVPLAERFAVSADEVTDLHSQETFEYLNPPEVLELLRAADEFPFLR